MDSLNQTKETAIDKTEQTTGATDLRSEQKPLTTKAYEVVAGAAGAVAGAAAATAQAAGNAASSVAARAQPHVEAAKESAIDTTEQTTGATDLRSENKPLTSKVVEVASGAAGATAGAVAAAAAAAKEALFGKGRSAVCSSVGENNVFISLVLVEKALRWCKAFTVLQAFFCPLLYIRCFFDRTSFYVC